MTALKRLTIHEVYQNIKKFVSTPFVATAIISLWTATAGFVGATIQAAHDYTSLDDRVVVNAVSISEIEQGQRRIEANLQNTSNKLSVLESKIDTILLFTSPNN